MVDIGSGRLLRAVKVGSAPITTPVDPHPAVAVVESRAYPVYIVHGLVGIGGATGSFANYRQTSSSLMIHPGWAQHDERR